MLVTLVTIVLTVLITLYIESVLLNVYLFARNWKNTETSFNATPRAEKPFEGYVLFCVVFSPITIFFWLSEKDEYEVKFI